MSKTATQKDQTPNEKPRDEDVGIMIYGNIKIRDLDTGKLLVNQRA